MEINIPQSILNVIELRNKKEFYKNNGDKKDTDSFFKVYDAYEKSRKFLQDSKNYGDLIQYWDTMFSLYHVEEYRIIDKLANRLMLDVHQFNQTKEERYYDKRPYGNKNISASIIFTLGIDMFDVMTINDRIPDEIEDICMYWHKKVGEELKI